MFWIFLVPKRILIKLSFVLVCIGNNLYFSIIADKCTSENIYSPTFPAAVRISPIAIQGNFQLVQYAFKNAKLRIMRHQNKENSHTLRDKLLHSYDGWYLPHIIFFWNSRC